MISDLNDVFWGNFSGNNAVDIPQGASKGMIKARVLNAGGLH